MSHFFQKSVLQDVTGLSFGIGLRMLSLLITCVDPGIFVRGGGGGGSSQSDKKN